MLQNITKSLTSLLKNAILNLEKMKKYEILFSALRIDRKQDLKGLLQGKRSQL